MTDNDIPPDEFDDEPTTREIPRETMAALVFGVGYNHNRGDQ